MKKLYRAWLLRLGIALERLESQIAHATLPRFGSCGSNVRIARPRRLLNADRIHIGDDVSLGPGCLLNPVRRYPGRFAQVEDQELETTDFDSRIVIGNRVSATGYLTIGAADEVVIEDDVLIASHVYVGDNQHGMRKADVPYKYQPLERISPVRVGRGAWIGEHVVILAGVSIGEFCVIGANSVVTRDIPARSVALGAPARVVRRWSDSSASWIEP